MSFLTDTAINHKNAMRPPKKFEIWGRVKNFLSPNPRISLRLYSRAKLKYQKDFSLGTYGLGLKGQGLIARGGAPIGGGGEVINPLLFEAKGDGGT